MKYTKSDVLTLHLMWRKIGVSKGGNAMKVTIEVEQLIYDFYGKIGKNVGKTPEQVMADALFRLAGELSFEAIAKKK